MMISNQEQLYRLFCCLGFGVWFSFLNDSLRVLRLFTSPAKHKIFIQDMLLCTGGAILLFLFALPISGGELRVVMLIAVLLGFLSFRFTVGRLMLTAARRVSRILPHICLAARQQQATLHKKAHIFQKKVAIFFKKGLHSIHTLVYNQKRK